MKKLLVTMVAAAAVAFAGNAAAKDWNKIRIGVEGAYPPFSSVTPEGKLIGFDIEVAEALCAEMGAECELVQQDWDGIIPALLARKYDAIIASMSITEERKKKVAFHRQVLSDAGQVRAEEGLGHRDHQRRPGPARRLACSGPPSSTTSCRRSTVTR